MLLHELLPFAKIHFPRLFLCGLMRYWLESWNKNLSWRNTDQVWLLLCLTYIYTSLLKISFPDFSHRLWHEFGIWICIDNTKQVPLLCRLQHKYSLECCHSCISFDLFFQEVCLWSLLGSVGDMYCFSITFRMLFMPPDRMIGGILFLSCLSVCLLVCLSFCLSVVNFNLPNNFWPVRDRDFILGMHTPLMTPFQMTPRSMIFWPWLWPWS